MREGGKILARTLQRVKESTRPGIKTKDLDKLAVDYLTKEDAEPSFLGFKGFPKSVCVSINEEIVHGIPGNREIKNGDLVSLDLGVYYKNLYTDAAITFAVGKVPKKIKNLIEVTKKALELAIEKIKPGIKVGDLGFEIQQYAESCGFSVIRDLVGHGVGKKIHENPQIPNYGIKGTGFVLEEGMTLALEPMISTGGYGVKCLDNNWTFVTTDGSITAHFEDTIAIIKNGCEVLTHC